VTTAPDSPADENRCIRRWYSTWTVCNCITCRRQRRHHRKLAAAGLTSRVPSDQAWEVIDLMLSNDWSFAAIASACGITDRSAYALLDEMRAGHRRVIGAVLAGRIVCHGEPTRGHVSAIPCRRKIQALARLGHSGTDVARAAGLWFTAIAAIRRGETRKVTPATASAVDKAWRLLCMTLGTDERSRRKAEREGWPPPLAWDDIDDLASEPEMPNQGRRGPASTYSVEEAVDLLAKGWTIDEVACRFNVQPDSVARRIRRAERRGEAA
jgi:hypothetical protein